MSLDELEKKALLKPLEIELDRQKEKNGRLKSELDDLRRQFKQLAETGRVPKLTEEQRKEKLAPVEREIRRIAYPPTTHQGPLIMGPTQSKPNVFALRVNAQAVVEELDALRSQIIELNAAIKSLNEQTEYWMEKSHKDSSEVLKLSTGVAKDETIQRLIKERNDALDELKSRNS